MSLDARSAPAVAVCVPLYCKEQFIAETIRSVLDQTFADFELVIVDNASSDRSVEIVRSFDDPRIVLVRNEATIPPIENFNRSVELSTAPLVKLLCADDVLHPACLEQQVAALQADPTLAMVTCRHDLIDESGRLLARDRGLRTADLLGRQGRTSVLRRLVRHGGNPVGTPANVTFRRAAFDAVGGFPSDVDFFVVELGLWLRLLEHGHCLGVPETLLSFRINSSSDSARLGGKINDISREFVADLCRDNASVVRLSDRVYSSLRAPLTRLRFRMLLAAAGHQLSWRTRAARGVLSVNGKAP